jgi:hypothetical protein
VDTDTHEYVTELLEHAGRRVKKAEEELAGAERARRIDAAIAIRHGYGKVATAAALGISRPTLDAWLDLVERTADERKAVDDHIEFAARRAAKATIRASARKTARRG